MVSYVCVVQHSGFIDTLRASGISPPRDEYLFFVVTFVLFCSRRREHDRKAHNNFQSLRTGNPTVSTNPKKKEERGTRP